MKSTTLSLLALSVTLGSSAFAQQIVGYTSLGAYNRGGTFVNNAPNPVTNKIYASTSTAPAAISVISGSTHKVTASVTASANVEVLAVNSTTNTIYSLNQDQTISVIDGSVDQLIATIPSVSNDNCITNMVVDEPANKVALIDECNGTVYVLDGTSYALLSTISLSLQFAEGAAVNPVTHLLYITGDIDGAMAVVDLTSYTATTVSMSFAEPFGVAVDTTLNRIYIGDDVFEDIYVFDGATNTMLSSVAITYNALQLLVNQKTHILATSDDRQTLRFYHDFNLATDGQVSFGSKDSILFLSGNSNNNLFYTGVSPINALAFVQGPTH